MPKEKSAGAIIFRKEGDEIYYLLLHYPTGHWEFPKGHVEAGESEEETVRREVFEETGLGDIKIIPGFKQYIKYFFRQYPKKVLTEAGLPRQSSAKRSAGGWVFKLVAFFVAETNIKDVQISHEHTGFLWLPLEQAVKKTTFKNSKDLLKKSNEFILSRKSA